MTRVRWLLGFALLGAACTPTPPLRWQEGGATLVIAPARWERGGRNVVAILADGTVEERGRPAFWLDRVGRVADGRREPLAVLLPDGIVAGVDDTDLGRVGVANASPPGATYAWLTLLPDGEVVRFDAGGDRVPDGGWTGCDGPVRRTCTLVTHLVALRALGDRTGPAIGIGVGIGL